MCFDDLFKSDFMHFMRGESMELVYATLFLAFGVMGFVVALLGSRNPRPPFWATDFIIGSILVPLVIGAVTIGLAFLIKAILDLDHMSVTLPEMLGIGAIAAVTLTVCKLIRIKRRLAAYDAAAHRPV